MENNREKRSFAIYLAAVLTTIAAGLDTMVGMAAGWPVYIYFIVWIQMAAIVVTAVNTKVPLKAQALVFSLCVWNLSLIHI